MGLSGSTALGGQLTGVSGTGISYGAGMIGEGRGWEADFDSFANVPAALILDYAGVAGGQFLANDDNTLTFDDIHTFTRASEATHRDSAGLVVTAASGAHRLDHDKDGNRLGLLVEEARENLSLWSDDWTNAAYDTVTNLTPLKDQTGADGVANSASSLLATAANAIITQSITNASATRVYSVHIKRLAGTGNIELTQDGGSTWLDIKALIDGTSFTQVATVAAAVTNPVVGIRIVTDTDKIAVQYGDSEIGPLESSPISTTTASVPRALEVVLVATSAWAYSTVSGTWFAEFDYPGSQADRMFFEHETDGSDRLASSVGGAANFSILYSDGTTQANLVGTADVGANKIATGYAVDDFVFAHDGAVVSTDTSGTYDITPDTLSVGGANSTPGSAVLGSHIKEVVYYRSRLSDADLVEITT